MYIVHNVYGGTGTVYIYIVHNVYGGTGTVYIYST